MSALRQWAKDLHLAWKLALALIIGVGSGVTAATSVASSHFVTQQQFQPVRASVDSLQAQVSSMSQDVRDNTSAMDSLWVELRGLREDVGDVRLYACQTLAELRGEPATDRCGRLR